MTWDGIRREIEGHDGRDFRWHAFRYEFFSNALARFVAPKVDYLEIGSFEGVVAGHCRIVSKGAEARRINCGRRSYYDEGYDYTNLR